MAASKRVVQRFVIDNFLLSKFSDSYSRTGKSNFREISQLAKSNGSRAYLVDTLALVRRLEGQGVPSKQAEAITSVITEVLNDSLENVAQSFVSRESQKNKMIHDSNLSRFKSEIQSTQEHQFSLLQRDTEKLQTELQRETEKIRTELRYQIDKVTAGQKAESANLNNKLDLVRYEIDKVTAGQKAESANLNNKLDLVSHAMREQLEAAKYDVIKYSIGTLVSISAVGLAVIRILM